MKVIDKAIASAGPTTYQLQLIHGYNRGRKTEVQWTSVLRRPKRSVDPVSGP